MKTLIKYILGVMLLGAGHGLQAQGTAFTYQGQLFSGGGAANGSFDLSFNLFTTNNGGAPAATAVTNSATAVSNGLFLVTLDFGAGVFYGTNYWLEIGVRTNGGGSFTILSPRQPVTPAPYAIFASTAGSAGNLSGSVNAAQLAGAVANNQLAHSGITVTAGTGLGGGGAVALGGAVTLNNAGVTAVTGNADITAATVGGTVTLGDTATAANTVDTIIKRDGSGNFSATTLTLNGQLNLAGALVVNGTTVVNASGQWVGGSTGLVGPQGPAGPTGLAGPAGATGATGNTGPQGPAGPVGATGAAGATGAQGPQGLQGVTGATGAVGPAGTNGNTIWHGTGAPAATLGTNGDFYINTSGESLYGPKTAGSWGSGVSLVGPQGATGAAGLTGAPGAAGPAGPAGNNGNTIWSGTGAPALTIGVAGDFYLNTSVPSLYGPKTASSWGSGVSLVGPQGPTGPAGPAGTGSTLESLGIKTGSVTGSVSAQGVANLTVTFTTPFATTNYAIVLTPRIYSYNSTPISVNAYYNSKSTAGFTVNLVTDLLASSPPAITCDWSAISDNNP